MEVPEQDAPLHSAVQEGRGEEVTEIVIRGGAGGPLQVIQRLWAPPGDGYILLIPEAGDLRGGRRMAGGG